MFLTELTDFDKIDQVFDVLFNISQPDEFFQFHHEFIQVRLLFLFFRFYISAFLLAANGCRLGRMLLLERRLIGSYIVHRIH